MRSYVWHELVRNPRRTLASLTGMMLGVGLFAAVLFFVDGSGATLTQRALAPLVLDMQSVLTAPPGGGVTLDERVLAPGRLRPGQQATIELVVENEGSAPANEVVVSDEPPRGLAYVQGSTTLDGTRVADVAGQSPLVGLAGSGLNVGTVRPGAAIRLVYRARAHTVVPDTSAVPLRGKVSSREDIVPIEANGPPPFSLEQLRSRIARIPGVAAADTLSFVDLPAGTLRAGGVTLGHPVRVFAFDPGYAARYPSIRIVAGSFVPGATLVSVEAARALRARPGDPVQLRLPGRGARLALKVGGVADLARAQPLFSSRKSRKLEDFLYVPDSIVVPPGTFRRTVVPALREAAATQGSVTRTFALREVDVQVDRSRLRSEPATALAQTVAIAQATERAAPGQSFVIDNVSNALGVARADAAVGKRMFVFLGLPGVLLAAFFAAYAGAVLAAAQRREQANLRVRGAHRGHLLRMLAYRTVALAGVAALLGVALGFVSAAWVLGWDELSRAAPRDLAESALLALGVGVLVASLGLYVPGHRSLRREIGGERAELRVVAPRAWRRPWVGLTLLAVAVAAQAVALASGAFDAPAGSVSSGRSVSLPSYLLLAPLAAWIGGALAAAGAALALASRLPHPRAPRFGPVVRGTLTRSLRRRSWALAGGILGLGLVVALGTSLAIFSATYDAAKQADSRFVVGADLRVTPDVTSERSHGPGYASSLLVPGVITATPVVAKLENSVVIGRYNQARTDLAAIDPDGFSRTAPLSDSGFADGSAAEVMSALGRDPRGVLVSSAVADDLTIETGDVVRVILARGTANQTTEQLRVVGLFERFPGVPVNTDLVANLSHYAAATHRRQADFFLVRTADDGHAGLVRAVTALQAGPARNDPIDIDTTETVYDKDQSSLVALDIRGLVRLDSVYTLLLATAAIAIFVFGLMLQRRREYVTLRALGAESGEVPRLVAGEALFVAGSGVVAGILVGTGMAAMLVHVLRPLFVLEPALTFPIGTVAALAGLVIASTLASALVAGITLRRLRPVELLREI